MLEHVAHVYETNCPTSPHQRDRQRRLLASHVWEEKQAMIQTETLQNLFNIFVKEYPDDKLSFTKFKSLKPWYLKKAYRETCLCRMCELYRLYVAGLHAAADLLFKAFNICSESSGGIGGGQAGGDSTAQVHWASKPPPAPSHPLTQLPSAHCPADLYSHPLLLPRAFAPLGKRHRRHRRRSGWR